MVSVFTLVVWKAQRVSKWNNAAFPKYPEEEQFPSNKTAVNDSWKTAFSSPTEVIKMLKLQPTGQ